MKLKSFEKFTYNNYNWFKILDVTDVHIFVIVIVYKQEPSRRNREDNSIHIHTNSQTQIGYVGTIVCNVIELSMCSLCLFE